ncbi:hypothetical protein GOB93_17840 [Acetobacter musti]|uniref:Uncharacterized protein n=1 Tax=Acetobacter musti TaxID=864732 RepID=A0ABX0JVE1_9PROT|nr:hypothetical protein [Acetobacter musti]NHN86481.1 hypothetical protein [Acetobacter musti]
MERNKSDDTVITLATELVARYGRGARMEAGERCERAHKAGDSAGAETWLKVFRYLSGEGGTV